MSEFAEDCNSSILIDVDSSGVEAEGEEGGVGDGEGRFWETGNCVLSDT